MSYPKEVAQRQQILWKCLLDLERRLQRPISMGDLLDRVQRDDTLAEHYPRNLSRTSQTTRLRRDLRALEEQGRARIEGNHNANRTYVALSSEVDGDDDLALLVRDALCNYLPEQQLNQLVERIAPPSLFTRATVIADNLRLRPARVLADVKQALEIAFALHCPVRVVYGEPEKSAVLHPLALLQRGPFYYLYALKDDEPGHRMFALHRMAEATALREKRQRNLPEFSLEQEIANGRADFGSGKWIRLVALVRGYIAKMLVEDLHERSLGDDQQLEQIQANPMEYRLTVTLPSTGQLFRWLLSLGANIEVIEPEETRAALASQAHKMVAQYHKYLK